MVRVGDTVMEDFIKIFTKKIKPGTFIMNVMNARLHISLSSPFPSSCKKVAEAFQREKPIL
jgi:hypothetical protein